MNNKWVTKHTLLMRAKNQDDSQAWQDFVDYYKDFINILLRRLNVSAADMDDMNQEILLKVWKNLSKFKPGHIQFRTWLNCLIRNKVIDFFRKRTRINKLEAYSVDEDSVSKEIQLCLSEQEFDDIIETEWRTYLTNRAMKNIEQAFSGKAIEVFNMCLEEIPVNEISQKLDITASSVYKLKSRVQEKLLDEIKRLKEEIEF